MVKTGVQEISKRESPLPPVTSIQVAIRDRVYVTAVPALHLLTGGRVTITSIGRYVPINNNREE